MIYANIKNVEERERLYKALRTSKSKNWYRRLNIIALSSANYTVKELSEMFNLCEATIRNYIHSYNQGGLENLMPTKPSGRLPKISNWTREQWDEIMSKTPRDYERLNAQSHHWTLELLCLYLREYHGISVSIVSIHNSLKKTGTRIEKDRSRSKFIKSRHLIGSAV